RYASAATLPATRPPMASRVAANGPPEIYPLSLHVALPIWLGAEVGGRIGRRGLGSADPLQVEVADEADGRSDEHLHTADDEQPGARIGQGLGEEHEGADEEPQSDEDVIGDADELVALTDDEF